MCCLIGLPPILVIYSPMRALFVTVVWLALLAVSAASAVTVPTATTTCAASLHSA